MPGYITRAGRFPEVANENRTNIGLKLGKFIFGQQHMDILVVTRFSYVCFHPLLSFDGSFKSSSSLLGRIFVLFLLHKSEILWHNLPIFFDFSFDTFFTAPMAHF